MLPLKNRHNIAYAQGSVKTETDRKNRLKDEYCGDNPLKSASILGIRRLADCLPASPTVRRIHCPRSEQTFTVSTVRTDSSGTHAVDQVTDNQFPVFHLSPLCRASAMRRHSRHAPTNARATPRKKAMPNANRRILLMVHRVCEDHSQFEQ